MIFIVTGMVWYWCMYVSETIGRHRVTVIILPLEERAQEIIAARHKGNRGKEAHVRECTYTSIRNPPARNILREPVVVVSTNALDLSYMTRPPKR